MGIRSLAAGAALLATTAVGCGDEPKDVRKNPATAKATADAVAPTAPIALTDKMYRAMTPQEAEALCQQAVSDSSPSYGGGEAIDRRVEALQQAHALKECLSQIRAAISAARAEAAERG